MLQIFDCTQGSDEWFACRAGIPTASMFSTVMASGRGGGPSVTRAEIAEAHRGAALHRFNMMKLAKVDETKAGPGDLDLVKNLLAITDGNALDKALARKEVTDLFTRGVIYFGERHG